MKKISNVHQIKKYIWSYLAALVLANLIVKHFGPTGIWFASFFLIPFDFVCRCIFHETWQGKKLIRNLFLITLVSSIITIILNTSAYRIAFASICSIIGVQVFAGVIYQIFKKKSYLLKVNFSDLIAVVVDSLIFQFIAFSVFDWHITIGQMLIKLAGGLFWYFIIFKFFKFNPNEKR